MKVVTGLTELLEAVDTDLELFLSQILLFLANA